MTSIGAIENTAQYARMALLSNAPSSNQLFAVRFKSVGRRMDEIMVQGELIMKIYTWNTVPAEQLTESIKRRMIVGSREMLVRWEFKKGAVAASHRHPHEQIVVMVKGRLKLTVDGVETMMEPEDIVVIPPDTPHDAYAIEDTIVIDIFSPPRDDFLSGERPEYLG
jgi:quercetin dioxygenase-like cupin family protein